MERDPAIRYTLTASIMTFFCFDNYVCHLPVLCLSTSQVPNEAKEKIIQKINKYSYQCFIAAV